MGQYHSRTSWAIYLLVAIFSLCSILRFAQFGAAASQSESQSATELRGVWITNVDSEVLFSQKGVQDAVNRLSSLNFNTIYPTIWQGGYTLYPSPAAQMVIGRAVDPTPGLQGRDMLQEMVETGHSQGLSVIPWFEFGFMAPADSELARRHPDWLTQRRDETAIKPEGIHERVWLNPFHPDVQQFILDLITEVVSNYDIDGIQFDDHFGLPVEFGYDPLTIKLYQADNAGNSPADEYYETYWVRWRADQLNRFMERVFQTVKAIKPNCILSLSPNPFHFALPASLQDWFTWERRGWVEEIVLQVYRPDMERFTRELGRTEVELAKHHIPFAIGIMSGLRNDPTAIEIVAQQVRETRQQKFAGVSFFFYESLWNWAKESPEQRQAEIQKLFSTPAVRPAVKPSKGAVPLSPPPSIC
ncbi:MAG: family 10 glycosylhydrolase [Oscillatoriales cyanobacterium SM2_3_0]|nr:family 10 glycosylhydrolase [Oscillatoriales cyanobacterium SM2_3_0]